MGYLAELTELMKRRWPDNRTIQIVCHGHSVPAGYFATPVVDPFNAYPHLLHRLLKERYPHAVINVIVTAIGGEHSERGARRFGQDVLPMRPDLVTIDYGLNDRFIGLDRARAAWVGMIEAALAAGSKVILLTPTHDDSSTRDESGWSDLAAHAEQIRRLAEQYRVGLADSFAAFDAYLEQGGSVQDMLAWPNHPNHQGHQLVAAELIKWFPY